METEHGPRYKSMGERGYTGYAKPIPDDMAEDFTQNEWYERFMKDHKLNPPQSYVQTPRRRTFTVVHPKIGLFFFLGAFTGFVQGVMGGLYLSKTRPWKQRIRCCASKFKGPMLTKAALFPIGVIVYTLAELNIYRVRPYLWGWLVPARRINAPLLNNIKTEPDFDRPFACATTVGILSCTQPRKWMLIMTSVAFAVPFVYFLLRWHSDIAREWRSYFSRSVARDFQLASRSQFQVDYRDWRYLLETDGVPRPQKRLYEDDVFYENARPRWFREMNQVPVDRFDALRNGNFARRTFVGPIEHLPQNIEKLMLPEDKQITATGMPVPKPDRLARTDDGLTRALLRDKSKFDDPANDPAIEPAKK